MIALNPAPQTRFELHWQDEAGEWHPLEPAPLWQTVQQVADMFEGNKPPVVMEIDGGYVSTRNVYGDVRKRHRKAITFAKWATTCADKLFYQALGMKLTTTME